MTTRTSTVRGEGRVSEERTGYNVSATKFGKSGVGGHIRGVSGLFMINKTSFFRYAERISEGDSNSDSEFEPEIS